MKTAKIVIVSAWIALAYTLYCQKSQLQEENAQLKKQNSPKKVVIEWKI